MDTSIERQTEINEWSYNSKRETLFFSQLVFIGLSIIIIMYALSAAGFLGDTFVLYVMIIIFVLLGLIWYTRYTYTRKSRDSNNWNKIVFSEDGKKPSTLPSSVISSVATASTNNCAASASAAASGSPSGSAAGSPSGSASGSSNLRGSAAARNKDGSIYGDKNNDGLLGKWDSEDLEKYPDDVSNANLNEKQGKAFGDTRSDILDRINAIKKVDQPSSLEYRTNWCLKNPGAYDRLSGMSCKQYWCLANPTKEWKDTVSGVSIACKTLFPNLI